MHVKAVIGASVTFIAEFDEIVSDGDFINGWSLRLLRFPILHLVLPIALGFMLPPDLCAGRHPKWRESRHLRRVVVSIALNRVFHTDQRANQFRRL